MTSKFRFSLLLISCLVYGTTNAQIEVAHLRTKNFYATGFGAFLNFAIPVSEGANAITAEGAFYVFRQDDDHVGLAPFLLGYRHTFDGSGTGFYVEPMAGYTTGGTDIQKEFTYEEQKAKGITGGITTGYIIPGRFAFNIGLRYQHIFVSGDPAMNMYSLRLSHPLTFGRREE